MQLLLFRNRQQASSTPERLLKSHTSLFRSLQELTQPLRPLIYMLVLARLDMNDVMAIDNAQLDAWAWVKTLTWCGPVFVPVMGI